MITADPSTLRYGAQRFAAAAQEMQRNADRLLETTASVHQGQEGWSGEGAQSFQLRGERLAADVKQASSAFTSIANTMSRFAMRMERVLELRLRADQLDQRAFEYGDDTLDSIHTRQHLRHQAAQLRHQADSEASIADSQASAEFQMIAKMIPATLIPGADASAALLDGLPKHWQDYYRRHPELLSEEKIAPTLKVGSYKRADEVGVQEFLDEHQQDDQSILDKMQGFIAGGVDGEKELFFGLITAVSHPIDTVKDIAYAVTHPDLVVASLVRKKDEFVSDWKRGNTYGWSKTFHEIIWSVIGLKGAGVTEEGAELASTAVKSKIELFGNILTPSPKVILSDGTVIRVSDRVIQSNEELLSYFKGEQSSESANVSVGATERVSDDFVGTLKGEKVHLEGVKVKEIIYSKRFPDETAKLRKEFDSSVRKEYLRQLANAPQKVEQLRIAGLAETDIARMRDGYNPKGWQVHHKLPLDDGGTNALDNLILIRNDPYHKAITNEQNALTRDLAPGQNKIINWPIPEGDIYPSGK